LRKGSEGRTDEVRVRVRSRFADKVVRLVGRLRKERRICKRLEADRGGKRVRREWRYGIEERLLRSKERVRGKRRLW